MAAPHPYRPPAAVPWGHGSTEAFVLPLTNACCAHEVTQEGPAAMPGTDAGPVGRPARYLGI